MSVCIMSLTMSRTTLGFNVSGVGINIIIIIEGAKFMKCSKYHGEGVYRRGV